MDHAEARDVLEAAAVEPDGLGRLEAGDTPEAAALAGHLAGCASCAAELERLRASTAVVRLALLETPPPELRERTLAHVRTYGRPVATAGPVGPVDAPDAPARAVASTRRTPAYRAAWILGLAAALIVGVGLGGLAVAAQRQGQLDRQAATIAALDKVDEWTRTLATAPDAQTVALSSPSNGNESGSVLFSPTTTQLIAVMRGVAPPPPGREYRCWVNTGGANEILGKMYFGGDVGYWGGRSPAVAGVPAGAVFGVTLVDVATGAPVGEPVVTGTL